MSEAGSLFVRIKGDFTDLQKALVKVESSVSDFEQKLGDSFKKAGKASETFGESLKKSMEVAGGVLIAKLGEKLLEFGKNAIVVSAQFEKAMSEVGSATELAGSKLNELKNTLLDMGKQSSFDSIQLAEGLTALSKAGFSTKEALKELPNVMNLAIVGNMGMAETSKLAAEAVHAFGLSANELVRVADAFSFGANHANISVAELGRSLRLLGPIASQSGFKIEELVGVITAMANTGVPVQLASNAIRSFMTSIVKDSAGIKDILTAHNIELKNQNGQYKSIIEILEQFRAANLSAEESMRVFGSRGQGLSNILRMNATDFDKLKDSIKDMAGSALQEATAATDNLSGDFKKLTATIQSTAAAVGQIYLPVLRAVTQATRELVLLVPQASTSFFEGILGVVGTISGSGAAVETFGAQIRRLSESVKKGNVNLAEAGKLIVRLKAAASESGASGMDIDAIMRNFTPDQIAKMQSSMNMTQIKMAVDDTKTRFLSLWTKVKDGAKEAGTSILVNLKKPLEDVKNIIIQTPVEKALEKFKELDAIFARQQETGNAIQAVFGSDFGKEADDNIRAQADHLKELIAAYIEAGGKATDFADLNNVATQRILADYVELKQKNQDAMRAIEEAQKNAAIKSARNWEELAKAFKESGNTMLEGFGQIMEDIQSGMEDTVFKMIRHGTSFKDAMKEVWNTILDDFVKMIAKMVVQWLLGISKMNTGSGVGGLLGGLKNLFGGVSGGGGGVGGGIMNLIGKIPGVGGALKTGASTIGSFLGFGGSAGALSGAAGATGSISAGAGVSSGLGAAASSAGGIGGGIGSGLSSLGSGLSSFASVAGPVAGLLVAYNGIKKGNALQGAGGGALAGSFAGPVGMAVGAIVGGLAAYFNKKDKPSIQKQAGEHVQKLQAGDRSAETFSGLGKLQGAQGQNLVNEGVYVVLGEKLKVLGGQLQMLADGTGSNTATIAAAKDALVNHLATTGGGLTKLDANLMATITALGGTVTSTDYFKAAVQHLGMSVNAAGQVVDKNGNIIKNFGFHINSLGQVVNSASGAITNFKSVEEALKATTSGTATAVGGLATNVNRLGVSGVGVGSALGNLSGNISGFASRLRGINIPKFAKGGVIGTPTLAQIGEVPEVILPLSDAPKILAGALRMAGGNVKTSKEEKPSNGKVVNVFLQGTFFGDRDSMDILYRRGGLKEAIARDV